jgi:hypothetical protein
MKNNHTTYTENILICYDSDHEQQAEKKAKKMQKKGYIIVTNYFDNDTGYFELVKTFEKSLK